MFCSTAMEPSRNPSLTTVDTPRYDIGKAAANMLLQLMAGKTPAATRVDLGYQLLARDST